MNKSSKKAKRNPLKTAGIIMFWLVAWEIADRLVNNRIILTGPISIVTALFKQMRENDFLAICGASFLRIAFGFLLSFAAGFLLALVCNKFHLLRDFLEPVFITLKTVPMVSFVIMLLIWVGNQALTVYLSFLIVLPLIYTNTLAGFEHVDQSMLEMARVFKLSAWKKFWYIYRPAFMPFLISGCKISLGMSWKSGVMAEVLATPKPSIGREMYAAKSYLQTANLFAWTIVVIVLSIVFEKVFMLILKTLNRPMGKYIGKED